MDNITTKDTTTESFGYDYRTVETAANFAPETLDCYEALGWELKGRSESVFGTTTFNFRRVRRIKNKEQVNRLQIRAEDALNHIKVMEKQKTSTATTISLIIGIIGSLFFGSGLCIFLVEFVHQLWHYIAGGILAAIGAGICLLGYYSYLKVRGKKTQAMNIQIEKKRDEIAAICEDAARLLV